MFAKLQCMLFQGGDYEYQVWNKGVILSTYEKFTWVVEYTLSIILMLIVFGVGGVLTLISVGIVMGVHYLLYGVNLLLGKLLKR